MPLSQTDCASRRLESVGYYLVVAHAGRGQWIPEEPEAYGLLLDFTVSPNLAFIAAERIARYTQLEGGLIVTELSRPHGHFVMRLPIACPDGECQAALDEHLVIIGGILDRLQPPARSKKLPVLSLVGQDQVIAAI